PAPGSVSASACEIARFRGHGRRPGDRVGGDVQKLILVTPDGRRTETPLGLEPATIGRSRENTLPIVEMRASRRHCRVEPVGGRWFVVDEGSRNGTLLNGKLIQRAPLSSGDLIEIGATRVFFDTIDEE